MAKKVLLPKLIDFILLICFIGVALALIVSDCSIYINPVINWIPAFAGLAYIPLFILNLFGLLYFLRRRNISLTISLLAIVIGFPIIPNSFSLKPSKYLTQKEDSSFVRLMTWNVRAFVDMNGSSYREGKRKMITEMSVVNPDVLCLQEFSFNKEVESEDVQFAEMKKELGMKYSYWNKGIGMVTLSKYPIVYSGLIEFQERSSGNQCLFSDINKNGKIFRLYNVHLESIKLSDRQVKYVRGIVLNGESGKRQSTRRIASQLRGAFDKRAEQVRLVKENIITCSFPVVIAGDFNDPPASYAFYQMQKGLKVSFREAGSGFIPITYNRSVFMYQIDHVMMSNSISVMSHYILRKKLSDHYAIVSDFKI